MELRTLKNFLIVAREENITRAAELIHISQPALTRQIHALETELGKRLFVRGKHQLVLTQEGEILRDMAAEILELAQKTEVAVRGSGENISGEVFIGAGESDGIRFIARHLAELRKEHPKIRCNFYSADRLAVKSKLDKGLLDFGLVYGDVDLTKFERVPLPIKDTYGVLMRRDDALANKKNISPKDLWTRPLIISQQSGENGFIQSWLKKELPDLNIVATYNLVLNAAKMVSAGLGIAMSFENLIETNGQSELIFRRCSPLLQESMSLVWKKNAALSPAATCALEKFKESAEQER